MRGDSLMGGHCDERTLNMVKRSSMDKSVSLHDMWPLITCSLNMRKIGHNYEKNFT